MSLNIELPVSVAFSNLSLALFSHSIASGSRDATFVGADFSRGMQIPAEEFRP